MSNAFNMTPDEGEKQREEQRRQALKDGVVDKDKEKNTESQENEQKKLDIDGKNSYIKDTDDGEGGDSSSQLDEEQQRLQAIVDKTFGGDPYKAVKSWREAQKSFSQMREEFKQVQAERDTINQVMRENPQVAQLFDKAYRGELRQGDNIQNFLNESREPQGQPSSYSQESKLSAIDEDVSEDTLVREGFLNKRELDLLDYDQKQLELQRAKVRYMYNTLPRRMAEQASKEYQRQISQYEQDAKVKEQKRINAETNKKRYHEGIQKVVDDYGLDFAGQDKELLDEIDKVAMHIIDPSNPYVIDEDAISLATQKVLRKNGRDISPNPYQQKKLEVKEKENSMYDKNTFNTNTRNQEKVERPKSIADKIRQRRHQAFQRDMELRRKPK